MDGRCGISASACQQAGATMAAAPRLPNRRAWSAGEGGRGGWRVGPGEEKKRLKFHIQTQAVPGLKKFMKSLLDKDKITKNIFQQESLEENGHSKKNKWAVFEFS